MVRQLSGLFLLTDWRDRYINLRFIFGPRFGSRPEPILYKAEGGFSAF